MESLAFRKPGSPLALIIFPAKNLWRIGLAHEPGGDGLRGTHPRGDGPIHKAHVGPVINPVAREKEIVVARFIGFEAVLGAADDREDVPFGGVYVGSPELAVEACFALFRFVFVYQDLPVQGVGVIAVWFGGIGPEIVDVLAEEAEAVVFGALELLVGEGVIAGGGQGLAEIIFENADEVGEVFWLEVGGPGFAVEQVAHIGPGVGVLGGGVEFAH